MLARNSLTVVIAILVGAWVATTAQAQSGALTLAKKDSGTEQIIIQKMPQQQSRIRRLLLRLFGKAGSKTQPTTGSEVVTGPKGKMAELEKRLSKLGAKVTKLRENWNHLLCGASRMLP